MGDKFDTLVRAGLFNEVGSVVVVDLDERYGVVHVTMNGGEDPYLFGTWIAEKDEEGFAEQWLVHRKGGPLRWQVAQDPGLREALREQRAKADAEAVEHREMQQLREIAIRGRVDTAALPVDDIRALWLWLVQVHILSRARGGAHHIDNIVLAHKRCNEHRPDEQ